MAPQSSHTKRSICTGLLSLSSKKRFTRITVTELCREVEIHRNTFYLYFDSKEDVVISCFQTS